jgi:hypothetical protein
MITVIKKYNPWVYKTMIRPLNFLARIQSANCASTRNLPTLNPMFDADHKKRLYEQQQQDISKIKHLLSNLGLKYTEDTIYRLWRFADKKVESVQKAVEFMLTCHSEKLEQDPSSQGITKPKGWLNQCLKY